MTKKNAKTKTSISVPGKNAMQRRVFWLGMTITFYLAACVLRLAYVQLVNHMDVSTAAVRQRSQHVIADSGRGAITDASGQLLAGHKRTVAVLFPTHVATIPLHKLATAADILGVQPEMLRIQWEGLAEPKVWQMENSTRPLQLAQTQARRLRELQLDGLQVHTLTLRYDAPWLAQHVIGYVSEHPELVRLQYADELASGKRKLTDKVGGAGLEKSLEPLLHPVGVAGIHDFTDGRGQRLQGLATRYVQPDNPYYPLRVTTTLDGALQQAIEQYADSEGLEEGAIVVLDVPTADIRTMVSRPLYDPYSLSTEDKGQMNRALVARPPGSLFKLLTAAAALESGVTTPEEVFHCNGHYGKYGLTCWKPGGHGAVSLKQALAESCNVVFAALGERLEPEAWLQTADRLGIGRRVGWHTEQLAPFGIPIRPLGEEEAGRLFLHTGRQAWSIIDGGQRAQTAIGQRDAAMTVLQAANLAATLATNGTVQAPRIVREVRFANGQLMTELMPRQASSLHGQLAPATAAFLRGAMREVVSSGTGQALQEARLAAAGKSGTALRIVRGLRRNDHWFMGYAPADQPRYAIAVRVENQPQQRANEATRLFRGILDIVAQHELAAH